jgi:putative tricarboxylic transport membrane protein
MRHPRTFGSGWIARAVEVVFTVSLLVISGAYLWLTTDVPDPPRNVAIGPRSFPYAVGLLMLVAAAGLAWQVLGAARTGRPSADSPAVPLDDDEDSITDWPAVWVVLGALLLLFMLIEPLGFVPAMTAFLFGLATFFAPSRWKGNIAMALGFSLIFYLLFTDVLGIALPSGPVGAFLQ